MHLPWQQSDLHPHALSLIEPDTADTAFALNLHSDLAAFHPPDIIHRYRIVVPHGDAEMDLARLGFLATRLTRIYDLPLDLQHHPQLAGALPPHIAPHWFLPGERAPWKDWVAAHWAHYTATHLSNPPRVPDTGLHDVFVGDDLVSGLALRDGPQGRTRAFSSLRDGQEIGWTGGDARLLPQLLQSVLRRATAIGWTSASLEVDDDDHVLWSLVDGLGIPADQTFVTWTKERQTPIAKH